MNGTDLLAEFKKSHSEKAFGELVRRYTNLVYSVARRRLSNGALAEEVTQTVFIRLASAAPTLRDDTALVAWLHRTTVHVSIDLWRTESRRRAREEHVAVMQSDADDAAWNELSPILDQALNELDEVDRKTVLLRYFDHKSMRELGAVFGISEDAAKMRVSRALERLRTRVARDGVSCGAVGMGALLSNRAVEAAPATLVAALMCLSFPIPAAVSGATAFSWLLNVSRARLAAGVTAGMIVGVGIFLLLRPDQQSDEVATVADGNVITAIGVSGQTNLQSTEPAAATLTEREPDPLQLLQTVARAREQIQSGTMELEMVVNQNFSGHTNSKHFVVAFDVPKARFESHGTEYRYTAVGGEAAEAAQAKMRDLGLERDREGAVRAGFLQPFGARTVSTFDGTVLLQYRESDGHSQGGVIQSTRGGSSEFITNPQCFGLRTSLFIESTVQSCLGYEKAKSIQLMGKESVEGTPAWRVQLVTSYDYTLDFWIDAARPERLLKQTHGADTVLSRYDRSGSAIPVEVISKMYRNGSPFMEVRLTRLNGEFNVPVPVSTFTLAGLSMKVGSAVTDVRSHRRIGYWNGVGLSDDLPRKGVEPEPAREMADLLALLDADPASSEAFEAAQWILFNTPDGGEVEKAAEVIRREHLANTNLVALSKRVEAARYNCSTNLLQTFLVKSPGEDVRANACYLLAQMKKEEAQLGKNQKATMQAIALFERVINEFGRNKTVRRELLHYAKPDLDELRRLLIGMPAPDAEGTGFDGEPISLRDYRGKIVVLVFWCCGYSEAIEHRKFVEQMADKPVALIGVSGDDNSKRAREPFAKYDITWPNIWDKQNGPITTAWNVRSWPNIWVLDGKGVIRYRDVRGPEMTKAVEALLAE